MSSPSVLIVDDDKSLLELLKIRLEGSNYKVLTVANGEEALRIAENEAVDLCVFDLRLNDIDGVSLMEKFHENSPETPVVILTAHGSIENAVEAMKRGAYNYITKPFEPQELLIQIERALEKRHLTSKIKTLEGLLHAKYDFANIVTRSQCMQKVLDMVSTIGRTDSTVYIHGESGTGKELVARAIHLASSRKEKAFIAINCAAIPESLLESELFGHEKGAFTGAVKSTKGLFTQAHEGTIFLDEIGDMPVSIQAKLLRVLEERRFFPIGGEKPIEVDMRIIVATNKDLEELIHQGLFRHDLYYRIHVIPIHLPPLRDRKEDIPPLVEHFLKKFNDQMKKNIKRLTPKAMRKLIQHGWPGNIRELENTMECAAAITQEDTINEDLILTTKTVRHSQQRPLKEAKEEFERDYLTQILEKAGGNISEAAKLAGKYRADLYELLKKHNLRGDTFKRPKSF